MVALGDVADVFDQKTEPRYVRPVMLVVAIGHLRRADAEAFGRD